MKLYIGPAGVPISCPKRGTIEGIKCVSELKLNLMEVQFVRGVKMKKEVAEEAREISKELGVKLTIHAPYYINLASERKEVIKKSIEEWIYKSAMLGDIMGAQFLVFHPASYGKRDPEEVFEIVKENLKKVLKKTSDFKIFIAPETTGKKGQFGSLDEIVRLVSEIKNKRLRFCLDFAHMHAREGGIFKRKKDFSSVFKRIHDELGEEYLKILHIHYSCIKYTEKGEREHLTLEAKDPDFSKFADALKDWKKYIEEINIVSESPNLEEDAIKMKKILKRKKVVQ